MDRRNFIKSTGIGLAAFILAGTLPEAEAATGEPATTPEQPKPHAVEWKISQVHHMQYAIVYGYDKKTLEVKYYKLAIPLYGPDDTDRMKSELVNHAREELIADGYMLM